MPKDDINYSFKDSGDGLIYDFYDVFVPAELFRQPALWTWGNDPWGQLGNAESPANSTSDRFTQITTFAGGTNWKSISAGNFHAAAIKTDGTLWTWGGKNGANVGHLGNNTQDGVDTPITTFSGGNDWKQVSGGYQYTAAVKTDGTLWIWGGNRWGELGINNTTNKSTPVTTFAGGTNWKQISCGGAYNTDAHTAAIKTDGTLWVWGRNAYGQLGINNTANRSNPVTTFAGGTDWKSVSCGYRHTAAIKTDGTLWVWGFNRNGYLNIDSGQLGINNAAQIITPVTTFAGGTNWKQVSCSKGSHTAAIKTDGTLWIWGYNGEGELGINNTISRSTPVTTFAGGTNWKFVSCGQNFTAALKTDGTVWTWGAGIGLGINIDIARSTPVTIFAGGNNWKQISTGDYYAAAIEYEPDP